MKGIVFYRGPSLLDGKPIIAVLTFGSSNEKTGPLAQTWIMREDQAPHSAVKSGEDSSVCGNCPLRPALQGGCYVITFQGPRAIWQSAKDKPVSKLSKLHVAYLNTFGLRLGSYGDPLAVPIESWLPLLKASAFHTGYTHQWQEPSIDSLSKEFWKGKVMASTSSLKEASLAISQGWKVFHISAEKPPILAVHCPADKLDGGKQTCFSCRKCDASKINVWIKPHGTWKGRIKGEDHATSKL